MNGWRLAAVVAASFGVGYLVRFAVCVVVCSERSISLYRRLLVAEANQDHAICNEHIAHLETRLDAYEHPEQAADEAERITREGS